MQIEMNLKDDSSGRLKVVILIYQGVCLLMNIGSSQFFQEVCLFRGVCLLLARNTSGGYDYSGRYVYSELQSMNIYVFYIYLYFVYNYQFD